MTLSAFPGFGIYFFVILTAAAAVTALVLRHLRIVDIPNERSSHSTPTPRGGGLGIVLGFFIALALIQLFGQPQLAYALATVPFAGFLGAVLLIGGISLHDDVAGRGFKAKLLVQLVAVSLVMACGVVAEPRQIAPLPAWLVWPLTLCWMVGLTNAYNFMDGLDAMAGGTAAVVAGFFAALCSLHGLPFLALLAAAICAGACGFLLFNWPPAKIFMGDIGSTFLGFAFAALAVLYATSTACTTPAQLLVMPVLLLHYLFDTIFTFCRRLLAGENVVQAHRTHLYQLLNRSGWSHRQVSLLYAGMAALQGLATLWMTGAADACDAGRIWIILPLVLGHTLFAAWVIRRARRAALL